MNKNYILLITEVAVELMVSGRIVLVVGDFADFCCRWYGDGYLKVYYFLSMPWM